MGLRLTLTRQVDDGESTTGLLTGTAPNGEAMSFATIELPWKNNLHQISCIPPGVYQTEWYDSPRHGRVLRLKDVPDRSQIEVHSANLAMQLLGCIALGKKPGTLGGAKAVLYSRIALAHFYELLKGETPEIEVLAAKHQYLS